MPGPVVPTRLPPVPVMPRSRLLPAILLAWLLVPSGGGVAAQPAPGTDAQLRMADSLVESGRVEEGLALLEARLEARPDDWEARWRAARASVARAVLAVGRPADRDRNLERAIEHGRRALELRPRGVEGMYWKAAASGRLALHARDARHAAELAQTVWDQTHAILAQDPTHAGAHNALGRLHYELMMLPGWKRTLGRLVAGRAMGGASWEDAERHLARALELEPGQLLYRRDLGELYLRRGRIDLARNLLETAADMRWRRPGDEVFKEEARALLRALDEGDGSGAADPR